MTRISDIVDPDLFFSETESGFIKANSHPTLDLTIYTYTREAQYEGRWNEATKLARGLILDQDGHVVARPFSKFFNYGEHGERDYAGPLPVGSFRIYDKVDGSLGIIFHYAGKWHAASKGSFTSEQAQWAQEWIDASEVQLLTPGLTYVAEIVYPENRIVVDYGSLRSLVLLAVIEPDGTEHPHESAPWPNGAKVRAHSAMPLQTILEMTQGETNGTEAEGFVLHYESGQRVKIKYQDYLRLHKIMTGVTERDIWRSMKEGTFEALLENVPDEFDEWAREVEGRIVDECDEYEFMARALYMHLLDRYDISTQRGELARDLISSVDNSTLRGVVFAMIDKKDYAPIIWKAVYPMASSPFKESDDA